ncbi:MAG: hypothetical protein WB819_05380, partial [Terriglobia bacterium]
MKPEDFILGPRVTRRAALRTLAATPILLMGAPALAANPAGLSGYWVLLAPNGDGTYRKSYFYLQQSGQTLTGKVMFGNRDLPISNGSVQNGKVRFEVVIHYRTETRRINYT